MEWRVSRRAGGRPQMSGGEGSPSSTRFRIADFTVSLWKAPACRCDLYVASGMVTDVALVRSAHPHRSAHDRRDLSRCPGLDRRELCATVRVAANRRCVGPGNRSSDRLPPIDARRTASRWTERLPVIDLIYVLATLAFFGLMVGYVRACERLGHTPSDDHKPGEEIA
jgi:hypothetical protein